MECGLEASGGRSVSMSTWHEGECDVCGKDKPITEVRDFFFPSGWSTRLGL